MKTEENPLSGVEQSKKKIEDQLKAWEDEKARMDKEYGEALEKERTIKVNRRQDCLSEAATLRELAPKVGDAEKSVGFIQKAKALELEAANLGVELGLADKVQEEPQSEGRDLSATKGLYGVLILALLTGLAFWLYGTSLVQNEENESAQRMMNSVGIRVIINFMLTGLAFLVAFLVKYLLFPNQFKYWHNRLESEFSLKQDLQSSQPWQRVLFFSFCLFLPIWSFVQLMQVIFG